MSDILSKLKAAHDKRQMVPVHLPEYDTTWFFPSVTLADQAEIRRGVRASDEIGLMVNFIVHMARDEDGTRVFDVPLKMKPQVMSELHRMPMRLLMRIVTQAEGGLSNDLSAEIADLDVDRLKDVLAEHLRSVEAEGLARAVEDGGGEVIRRAVTVMAEAFEAGQTTKNG